MPTKITTKRCNSILCQRFRPNGRKNFSLRHPENIGATEIEAFLTHLARNRGVSRFTQNQALNALIQGKKGRAATSRRLSEGLHALRHAQV